MPHAIFTAKRTPLTPTLKADDDVVHLNGYTLAAATPDAANARRGQLDRCALLDASALPRLGLRGPNAAQALIQQGYCLPERPNTASFQPEGSLIAQLSASEFLLLGAPSLTPSPWADSEQPLRPGPGCYLLPRQDTHGWLALTGHCVAEVMAKLCGVDLSPAAFPVGGVAQTSVARINAIVINASTASRPCFYLLMDSASATYLWSVLEDAIDEFDGARLGLMDYLAIAG
ncbi:hypothetical protein [Halomonas dongshanensis]|uniref:Sarcosine oxidase n=1 Tax=Halomonas dongshanensis TaxID=2890835 RepID=A0ABT2EHR6_9GAMM|nr:hypothetical protein [Halomonas dongshanensis]MCS2611129.1 hypothetical protein [Halomonas dongshanensis]